MNEKILVAYASKYGSTAEIAQAIAKTIRQAGLMVEIKPVDQVSSLETYTGVVLGSAVYAGQWRKEAAFFLKDHQEQLSEKMIWLFSSGPTGEGDPRELMDGWTFPENLEPIAEDLHPEDVTFFHGVLDEDKLGFAEKLIVKGLKAPLGDFRDWDMICRWAETIARKIGEKETIRENS